MGHQCSKWGRLSWIDPNKIDPRYELLFTTAEFLLAEISRVVTREVGLLTELVFAFSKPVVTGLRPGQIAECVDRDRHGDWALTRVSVKDGKSVRRKLFMNVRSVVAPVPSVPVELEIWKKLKETFHVNSFKLTTSTLVLRTKEFGFHVMTNKRVFRWDQVSMSFKVISHYNGIYRHFGLSFANDKLTVHDLKAAHTFESPTDVLFESPPVFDQHARRTLRFALVEGEVFFVLYDMKNVEDSEKPVFFDLMKYADDFQNVLVHMEVAHARFTKNEKIVNGRHFAIHMTHVTFAMYHDYNYAFIYNLHSGVACKIMEGNIGSIANLGNALVDMDAQTVLQQVTRYG